MLVLDDFLYTGKMVCFKKDICLLLKVWCFCHRPMMGRDAGVRQKKTLKESIRKQNLNAGILLDSVVYLMSRRRLEV